MAGGPLEYVVFGFEGNNFNGDIGRALAEAVDRGIIRVIDIVFARRDADGTLSVMEFEDLEEESRQVFNPVATNVTGLLSEEDIRELSEDLEPNTSAALLLFEHAWAENLRDALLRANGRLLAGGLIPREAVEAAQQASGQSAA